MLAIVYHGWQPAGGWALACCGLVDTAIPKFPELKEGSACAVTSGEFMWCLKVNGCIESVSLQGHLLTLALSTWAFGKEK